MLIYGIDLKFKSLNIKKRNGSSILRVSDVVKLAVACAGDVYIDN